MGAGGPEDDFLPKAGLQGYGGNFSQVWMRAGGSIGDFETFQPFTKWSNFKVRAREPIGVSSAIEKL